MIQRSGISRSEAGSVGRVLWSRFIWRHWCREPAMTAMLVGILALGVAVFLAVRLANKAAVSGFGLFTESVSGESDFLLRPRAGYLEEGLLRELRALTGATPVGFFPVLETSGALAGNPEGSLLRFVGTDLVALQNAAGVTGSEGAKESNGGSTFARRDGEVSPLGKTKSIFAGKTFAARQGVKEGGSVALLVNDRIAELTLAGILPEDPNRAAVPDNLVLMDLPGLQALADHAGKLSRIEIRFPEGSGRDRLLAEVAGHLHKFAGERDLILESPEDRKSSVTQMSAAFRLNLTILSGLALLVGIYLIMQAMEAAVVKRRAEIAVLRSLGVTPLQIRKAWFIEGLILGLIGSLAGVILGRLLAVGLVGAISKTVNTIYYETTSSAVTLHWGEAVFSLLFGVVASIVAGFIPAREAAMTPPAQAMRQGTQGGGLHLLRRWPLGLGFLIIAGVLALLPPVVLPGGTVVPLGGYLAAIALVFSASILIGLLFRPVARLLGFGTSNPMRRYAGSQLRRPEGRHRLTAAGLSVAIGMSAAMAILVASFETTLTLWIQQLLKADLYVAAAGSSSVSNGNSISAENWKRIALMPGVAGADKLQRYSINLEGKDVFLGGAEYNNDAKRFLQLIWVVPPTQTGPDALAISENGETPAWVSESFARRFRVSSNDKLELPTPSGKKSVRVSGVYAEYGNETGTILVGREQTSRWFMDDSLSNMAIYAEEGTDVERLLESIRVEFPGLVARTNERLRSESIRIFHQTFAVTYALE
ncbi:MAG: FtsX-like permease family protein, partial [Verrucomicrobiales bacterium]